MDQEELYNFVLELLKQYYPTDEKFIKNYTFKGENGLEAVYEFCQQLCKNVTIKKVTDYADEGFTVIADEGYSNYLNLFFFFVHPEARKTQLKDEMFDAALAYAASQGKQLISQCFNKNKPILRFYGSKAKKSYQGTFENEPTTYFCF